jgi:hypothetical protein
MLHCTVFLPHKESKMQKLLERTSARTALTTAAPGAGPSAELAERACQLLRYDEARKQLKRATTAQRVRERLRGSLEKHDIRPFATESVERYKAAQLAAVDGPFVAAMRWWAQSYSGMVACCGGAIATLVLLIISAVFSSAACLGMSLLTLLLAGSVLVAFAISNSIDSRYEWVTSPLSLYRRPIPEYALQTAVDIASDCPDVQIRVDELVYIPPAEQRRARQRALDPLLYILLPAADSDTQRLYLEVWNEPRFDVPRVEVADVPGLQ